MNYKPSDVGQVKLVLVCDYKCRCAAVTICATLVNIQTHTDTHKRQTALDQLSQLS